MKVQEILNLINQKIIKKGQFTTIEYQSIDQKTGYVKTSKTRVIFGDYYHLKAVKALGKQPNPAKANPNVIVVAKDILTYNLNTKNHLVHCCTTNCKSKCTYQDNNGNTIDKATYEIAVPPKAKNPSPVFQVKLQNVLKIGK